MSEQDTPLRSLSELMERPTWNPTEGDSGNPDPVDSNAAPTETDKPIDTPDDKPEVQPDASGSPDTADAASQPEPEKKYKYKDWDAAEAGAREAQSWGTKKAQEAAEARKEAERLRAELEAKRKEEAESQRPKPLSKEERAARMQQALDAIDALDPESPDYTAKRAELLADAMLTPEVPYVDEYTIEEKVRTEIERRETRQREADFQKTLIKEAEELAAKSGLKMKKGTPDYTLFWDALNRAPMGEGVTLEQQVDAMVAEVQKIKDGYRQEVLSGLTEAQQKQLQNAPLERHSTPTPGRTTTEREEPSEGPLTVSAILANQRQRRMI